MATLHHSKSVTRLLCTLVLSYLLLACGSNTISQRLSDTPPDMFSTIEQSGEQYLKQTRNANPADAFSWQVLAIRAWLQENNVVAAKNQLVQLQKTAPQEQQPILSLLEAQMALVTGHDGLSEQLLTNIEPDRLAPNVLSYYLLLQANRFEQQSLPIAAADMLAQRHQYLAGPAQQANLERIYALLAPVSSDMLRGALTEKYEPNTQAWLRLMAILNTPSTNDEQRNWQLNSWRNSYPEHPGAYYLPEGLAESSMLALDSYQPSHIAVLLPLTGQLATQAAAIRNGIERAHQGQASRLSFFDTQTSDMAKVYQQLQAAGADFIIGPLLKGDIAALANLDPAMPQLALNMPPQKQGLAHRYYFALSPESEAADAALHMWEQGHRQPLVFAPGNELGKRSATEFNRVWKQLSGQGARLAYFSSQQAIEADVRRALNTKASDGASPPLAAGVIQPIGDNTPAASNGAIDSLFMASNATETRFILPYFDFVRDSRAKRFPTYVTSRSFIPGGSAPMSELNGVKLGDMPWIFGGQAQLMAEVEQQWPNSSSSWLRLFALGYDAVSIIPQLNDLRLGSVAASGLTGDISINERGIIERRSQWMEYQDGDWQTEGYQAPADTTEELNLEREQELEREFESQP
ncbi:penicillin-binding protein activator [Oceanisphaera sp. IT1-181]|uniref:penicillin-binding protein activator n=1 Tax=Oceanisphaera sp. IT1-181 TaxID=3081199 RepID=UPI0029C9F79F|nr:penicillin-binding protein activator [Oceanisphaera sp. IT1-181]